MQANEQRIVDFLRKSDVQFVIPVYQRNYDWTEIEIKQLLNDIIAVENENRGTHFIGSIVYIHEGIYMTSSVQELVVIDGQQRLTTISILYVALYRFAKENGKDDTDRLDNSFLINQYARHDANRLKLKQTDKNAIAFKDIFNGNDDQIDKFSN